MKRLRLITALVVALVLTTGCATLQPTLELESGPYPAPNQGTTGAALGAAIGATPGVIARNEALAWGGALFGGAVGGLIGNVADRKNLAEATKEAREYRESIRKEWMETYAWLTAGGNTGKVRVPKVIVVDAERESPRGWRYDTILSVEQGLRQRGFEVVPPGNDFYRNYYRRVARDYSAYDADFLAEVLIQNLDSAVKVTLTLRSLKGMSGLDRQGIGHVRYSQEYRRYGPSRKERRTLAVQRAAKRAVENLFIHRYENTLEAS